MGARKKKDPKSNAKEEMHKLVGEFLKKKRALSGVTQQYIADSLELSSAQYISNIERGISPPSVEYMKAMISLCDVNPQELAFVLSKATSDFYLKELS